jgi:hypothetical protein
MTNLVISSETFAVIDLETFKVLSRENQERVLAIGVRQIWKALHSASVHRNEECVELATKILDGPDSLVAQFCRLAPVYHFWRRVESIGNQ